jgi:FMN phosphatase YigB (HAD superfamily)
MRAVPFDWRGTLVHDPPHEWWIARALERVERAPEAELVRTLCDALNRAAALPEVIGGERTCDCSPELHRDWSMMFFRSAGLDDELCESLYSLDFEPASHRFYPDAAPVLRALRERGCRVALVSDIHVDLRPEFRAHGIAGCFDEFPADQRRFPLITEHRTAATSTSG